MDAVLLVSLIVDGLIILYLFTVLRGGVVSDDPRQSIVEGSKCLKRVPPITVAAR